MLYPAACSAPASSRRLHNTIINNNNNNNNNDNNNNNNTTPSAHHHHQHNTISTSPPSTQHHQHNTSNTSPSTQHHQLCSTQHHQPITINKTPSTQQHLHSTSGSTAPRFAWQAQHLEHLRLFLRGRRSTWSTFIEAAEVWRRVMLLGAASFCVAGAALGAPQARFAWQAQHLEHLRFILRGRRSTWSTFIENHLHYIFKHTIIKTTPSPQHPQHNLINTTSSTHHHLHNTIYTTPSTLHHQTPVRHVRHIPRFGFFFVLLIPQLVVQKHC